MKNAIINEDLCSSLLYPIPAQKPEDNFDADDILFAEIPTAPIFINSCLILGLSAGFRFHS